MKLDLSCLVLMGRHAEKWCRVLLSRVLVKGVGLYEPRENPYPTCTEDESMKVPFGASVNFFSEMVL